jgi:hypothetical protein
VDWSLFNSKQAHDATLDALTLQDEARALSCNPETSFLPNGTFRHEREIDIEDRDGIAGSPRSGREPSVEASSIVGDPLMGR